MANAAETLMRDYISGVTAPPPPTYSPCWSGDPKDAPPNTPQCGTAKATTPAKSLYQKLRDSLGLRTYDSTDAWKKDHPEEAGISEGCEGWTSTPLECIKAKGLNVIFVLGGIAVVGAFIFSAVKGKP
jgi:hypothetical protein